MSPNRLSPSTSKPKQFVSPKEPVLKRVDSLPTHLPSNPSNRTEVKPVKHPITRAMPDTRPPLNFLEAGQGEMGEESIKYAAWKKIQIMAGDAPKYGAFEQKLRHDPEAMEIIKSRFPDYEQYSSLDRVSVAYGVLMNNPKYRAQLAEVRNEIAAIPNGATGARLMRKDEQIFLTNAFKLLERERRTNPFHIHGETAIIGNRKSKVVAMNYSPAAESFAKINKGDRYHLHTHPPFSEPFTSSASGVDHMEAANLYLLHNNKMETYVTNGKDVLRISPTSTELTKLIPDPIWEERLGKFPVAFQLPDPQQPPYPFSNHEAPAAFRSSERMRSADPRNHGIAP